MQLRVHCSIIYNSQDREATSVPISGRMDEEESHTHEQGERYSAIKKGLLLPSATPPMDLEGIMRIT